ncbi:MAG: acyltransferase family protein [Jatrophihabitans sp.]
MAVLDRRSGVAAAKPESQRDFRPDIQGLRAIAVSVVVIFHLYPSALPGGFVGVDVFFVISGFLITSHLARTFGRTGRIGLVDFYGRRLRRLMPAAVLVLTVSWAASFIALPTTQMAETAKQIRASALYFQNWVLANDATDYFSPKTKTPVQHFWSLSVEEQFYLVWPMLFLLAGLGAYVIGRRHPQARRAIGHQVMLGLALVVLVASLVYSIYYTEANPSAAYFVTTTRMWELAVGGVLALLPVAVTRRLARVGVLAWLGLGMVVGSAYLITEQGFPGSTALWPVLGAALLIASGSAAARLGPSWLTSLRPMVFLGDISYSLYLWHWPIIVLWKSYSGGSIGYLDGPAIAAFAILLSWLTKVWVEDRFRLSPFIVKFKWRSVATIVLAVIPVTLVSVWLVRQPAAFSGRLDAAHPGAAVLAGDATAKSGVAAVPDLTFAAHNFGKYGRGPGGCQTAQLESKLTQCVWGETKNYTKTIALVGDSVAGEWFGVLDALAKRKKWRLITDLHSLCPWTSTMANRPGDDGPYTTCHDWGKTLLSALLTTIKPDLVITSARPTVGTMNHKKPGKAAFAELGQGMVTYWKQLKAAGIPVVAIQESPEMSKNIPDCLSAPNSSTASCSDPASKAILQDTPLVVAAREMHGEATLIDLNRYICAPTICAPIVGNVVVYIDNHHITDTYARTIGPYLDRELLTQPALR